MTSPWETILVSLITLLALFFGLLVYSKNRKKRTNKYFLLLSLAVGVCISTAYSSEFFPVTNPALAILLAKITYVGVIWLMIFLLCFSFFFFQEKKVLSKLFWLIFSAGIFLSGLILFTNLFLENIEVKPWGFDVVYGRAHGIFLGFGSLLFIGIAINFFKNYKRAEVLQKKQLHYFFLGLGIFLASTIIFNAILPALAGIEKYYRFGNYSAIFFIGFTAYAIVTRQLFGVRVILTEILVLVMGVILLVLPFLMPSTILRILTISIFILFLIFGYLLIRLTRQEIQRREELQNAYAELKKLDTAKSEFISIASHQLRTPLTAIKGYISMMLEKVYGKPPEKMEKPLENIYASNERLIKLVNDILDVSRIETGRIEMELEQSSLEEIIESIVEELKGEAKKKNIYLKFEKLEKPLPKILIDRNKIRQAILNAVDNGIRYTEKGGVTIKLKTLDNKLQIIVSDTGAGMTKDELAKMFQSFSRGTAGGRLYTEGAGLGLYIARRLIELHQGKIWAESPGPGRGSTFYIELPMP